MVNLQELNYKKQITIDEEVVFPKEYYEKMDIIKMEQVNVSGKITLDIENNYLVQLNITGKMYLHDSVTYDEIMYPFDVKIEETLENSMKTLDLIEFLWQYIVLEVPLRITNSEISELNSENYSIISEEEYSKRNNPFRDFFNE